MKVNVRKSNYGFSTRLKNTQNDEEISMFMDVQFRKGFEPEEEALQIKVLDGFMSCYSGQAGVKPKIVVMEYEVLRVYDNNQEVETQSNETEGINIDLNLDLDDKLPF